MICKIDPHKFAGVLKLWCSTVSSLADLEKSLLVSLAPCGGEACQACESYEAYEAYKACEAYETYEAYEAYNAW